jgi:transposase
VRSAAGRRYKFLVEAYGAEIGGERLDPGLIISSAMVTATGTGDLFSKERDFGAWLGLIPKQISTGHRIILGTYQSTAIATCALCSLRPPGSCSSN